MTADQIARVVVALAIAITLAVLAAHPRLKQWEQRLGLAVLATSGVPFLLLGLLFRELGILTPQLLADLRPAFEFGLGWVGLTIGTHLDLRRLDRLPDSFMGVIALATLLPIVFAGLACGFVLLGFGILPGQGLIRDVLMLTACAAVSAPASLEVLLTRSRATAAQLVSEVTKIDQLAALAILAVIAVMFRPDRTQTLWDLPRSGWFLMTFGLGALLGIVIYVLVRRTEHRTEEMALLIGGVAFASGIAGYLALSVPIVLALAGVVLINAPLRQSETLILTLRDLERPLYLLFLFIVGSVWRPEEWQGWLLGVVFAASRAYGKHLASRAAARWHPEIPSWPFTVALLPESTIAIVVLFSASTHDAAALTAPVRWAINAVIVGSVLTDIAVQWSQRRIRSDAPAEGAS